MKSTKKIFVVAIAALMLFAFTACNNTVPSVYNGVVSAEVQQVKGYFNGEEVAEDGFQIVVNYAEGEPRIIKGNKGTIELDGNIANAAVGIEFKDFQQNPVVVVPTEVEYSVATSVTISGVEAYTVEEGWTPAAFDAALATAIPEELKNLAFTLSSGDFSSTYTIQNKVDDREFDYQLYLYDEDGKLLGHSDEAEEGDVYTVTLHAYMINDVWTTLPEDLDTGMTVNVVAKADPDTSIKAIEVLYTVTGSRDVNGTITADQPVLTNGTQSELNALASSGKLFMEDEIEWAVRLVKANDSTQSLSYDSTIGTENAYQVGEVTEGFNVTTATETTAGTAAKKAQVRYYDTEAGRAWTTEISIPVGTVTVAKSSSGSVSATQNDTTIAAGATIDNNNIKTYVDVTGLVRVDGKTPADPITADDYNVELIYESSVTIPESSTVPAAVVITYNSYGTTVRVLDTVDFGVKA